MKKRILLSVAAIVIIVIAWYFVLPSRTPAPQPPMIQLSAQNFSAFAQAFNHDDSVARLVLLVSPT
ncbi:MAG TPA: hypothetical protein VJN21_07480 [Candidatus Acidoferrales bacterium]|nr:hypothetical protein [Candidatus Acidoferrales bacterium]